MWSPLPDLVCSSCIGNEWTGSSEALCCGLKILCTHLRWQSVPPPYASPVHLVVLTVESGANNNKITNFFHFHFTVSWALLSSHQPGRPLQYVWPHRRPTLTEEHWVCVCKVQTSALYFCVQRWGALWAKGTFRYKSNENKRQKTLPVCDWLSDGFEDLLLTNSLIKHPLKPRHKRRDRVILPAK